MPEYLSPPQPDESEEPFSLPDPSQIETKKVARLLFPRPSQLESSPPELLSAPPPLVMERPSWWRRHPLWSVFIIAILLLQFVGDFAIIIHIRSSQPTSHTVPSPQVRTTSNFPEQTPTQPLHSNKTNVQQAVVDQTPIPTLAKSPTSASAKSPTPSGNVTIVHHTIIDAMNDWSKTSSHSGDLYFDGNNGQHFNGDTSLVYRYTNLHDAIVWNLQGMTTVQILTYFWQSEAISPFSMYTSSDNKTWTLVTPAITQGPTGTDAWQGYDYTLNHLSNVNYVKIVWNNMNGNSWSPQISQATLTS